MPAKHDPNACCAPSTAEHCSCGAGLAPTCKFCLLCHRVEAGQSSAPCASARAVRCPKCRTQFSAKAKFCRNCGIPRPTATVPPAPRSCSGGGNCSVGAPAEIVAIFADCDGCFDFISPTATHSWPVMMQHKDQHNAPRTGMGFKYIAEMLMRAIKLITQGRKKVILFVGSNRQSVGGDVKNAEMNGNGQCREAYEIMAAENGWELNRALLADYADELRYMNPIELRKLGPEWFADESRMHKHGTQWSLDVDESLPLSFSQDHLMKRLLITNGLGQLMRAHPNERIDAYFFDDRLDILEIARKVSTPEHIDLKTVWYDHVTFYQGPVTDKTDELGGEVPVACLLARGKFEARELRAASEAESQELEREVLAAMRAFERPLEKKYGKHWGRVVHSPESRCIRFAGA